MNRKIYIIDNRIDGHHEQYLKSLNKLHYSEIILLEERFVSIKRPIKYFVQRISYIKKIFQIIDKKGRTEDHVLNFSYIDDLIIPYWNKVDKKIKLIATLHQIPKSKIKLKILKKISKKFIYIIVHSKEIKMELKNYGIKNIKVIEYPNFLGIINYSKDFVRNQLNFPKNKIILTMLGSTRFDKGLDVLLNSFKFIDKNVKEKIIVNIAGEEDYFKKRYILKKSKENKIDIRLSLKFLSLEEFKKNLISSDFLVIPYRKIFKGSSGPLIQALDNSIKCIVSNNKQFYNSMKNNPNIHFFESENSYSLCNLLNNIEKMVSNKFKNLQKNIYNENSFIEKYNNIFNNIEEVYNEKNI